MFGCAQVGGCLQALVACRSAGASPKSCPAIQDPGRAAPATSLLQLRPASTVLKSLDTRYLAVYPARWQTTVWTPDDTEAHRLFKHYTTVFPLTNKLTCSQNPPPPNKQPPAPKSRPSKMPSPTSGSRPLVTWILPLPESRATSRARTWSSRSRSRA